jgi:hypothetical protein
METPTRVLGGVSVPDTPVIARALEHVRSAFDPFLFNHAVRSWLFAMRIAQIENRPCDAEVVAVGALLHDTGRFVLEAADLAADFARAQGMGGTRARVVWHCVALNSPRSLALCRDRDAVLCVEGIGVDIHGGVDERISPADAQCIVNAFPRLLQGLNLHELCGRWRVNGSRRDAGLFWPGGR